MNGRRRRRHPKMDNPSQFVVCLPRRTSSPLRTEVLDSSYFASVYEGEAERDTEKERQILYIWRPMSFVRPSCHPGIICPSVRPRHVRWE